MIFLLYMLNFLVIVKCKSAGAVFKSQPYRFAVQNGGYATIETEWTSFVNPWTRKLEFIIGYHTILQVNIK